MRLLNVGDRIVEAFSDGSEHGGASWSRHGKRRCLAALRAVGVTAEEIEAASKEDA